MDEQMKYDAEKPDEVNEKTLLNEEKTEQVVGGVEYKEPEPIKTEPYSIWENIKTSGKEQ